MATAPNANPTPARRLWDENAAAEFLDLSPRTLQLWRRRGDGPSYIKLGSAVRYDPRAIESFIAKSARTNTSAGAGQ